MTDKDILALFSLDKDITLKHHPWGTSLLILPREEPCETLTDTPSLPSGDCGASQYS